MILKEITLEQVLSFFNGRERPDNNSGEYSVFGSNGIISKSSYYNYEDCIVIGRVGAYCGSVNLAKHKIWATDNTIIAKVKEFTSSLSYFYYLLNNAALNNYAGGAAQPLLTQKTLNDLKFKIHDEYNQKKIAAILSRYDDLIQINQQRIALLEEAAQRLYDEWFVKLRFPNHEQVPVVEGVPEGWDIKKVGDAIPFQYGKSLKADSRVEGKYPVYGSSGVVGYHNEAFVQDRCIIVGRKGNAGSVFFSNCACYPIDTVFYIEPNINNLYFYFFLKSLNFVDTDSAVPGLNRNYVHSFNVLIPSSIILKKFIEKTELVFKQIHSLSKQNQKLTQARNELLPRLMSGQLDISKLT